MTVLIRDKWFLLGLVPWAMANVSDLVQQRRADLAVRVDGDRQGRRQLPRRAGKPWPRPDRNVRERHPACLIRAAYNMPPVPTKPLGSAFKLLAVRASDR
jgi:hypothetical protein